VVDGSQGSTNEGADPEDPLQNNHRNRKRVSIPRIIYYPIHSLD
jgi:hypothetical protein